MLNPDEWNDALDEALQELYYLEAITVTLVNSQNRYDLTTTNTWLLHKGQVVGVYLRDISDGVNNIKEYGAPAWRLPEEAGVVYLYLPIMPGDVTNIRAIVYARRYYGTMAADTDTTTAPLALIMAGLRHKALEKIYHLFGERAKKMFGNELGLAEKRYTEMRERHLPRIAQFTPHQVEPNLVDDEFSWTW